MKTSEIRQDLINIFTSIINGLTDEAFTRLSKNVANEGIADIAGKSRKEQTQMFKAKINPLNREELIKKRHKLSEYK